MCARPWGTEMMAEFRERRKALLARFQKIMGIVIIVSAAALFAACSGGGDTSAPGTPFGPAAPADFSSLPWTEAFAAAHQKFSREYAFSQWKGIDWQGLYAQFLPRVQAAQAAGDATAYYQALHDYLHSIPDGHIMLMSDETADPTSVMQRQIGGSFGLAVAELDDGAVIAPAVAAGGLASSAGIVAGAQILKWNGGDTSAAIGAVTPNTTVVLKAAGYTSPPATAEYYRLQQASLLTRAPVGATVSVVFKNPGGASQTVTLTAMDDSMRDLSLFTFTPEWDMTVRLLGVAYRILPEEYGYILVTGEGSTQTGMDIILGGFRLAITIFNAAGIPGVVLDLRSNTGGSDAVGCQICNSFYSQPSFYEQTAYYDTRTGQFTLHTWDELNGLWTDALRIEPATPYYGGRVAVLVNPATESSGEGPAMCLARLGAPVIGFHGTNGSFGMTGGSIAMPGGHTMMYPFGRSLDENGVIQLDSRNGVGGVAPTVRVPKTFANVMSYAGGTDVELQAAVRYLQSH
jgi:carboxyl-terminal processing protease